MPHLTLEYSSNLQEKGRIDALCHDLAQCLIAFQSNGKSIYPVAGIRVRALPTHSYYIADGSIPAGFVHANFKIGTGRSEEVRKATGDALFSVMSAHFSELDKELPVALSLEVNEFNELGSWKKNSLHQKLNQTKI